MSKKKPLIGMLVAFAIASVLMLVVSVTVSLVSGYGTEFALACLRLADGWVFGVLVIATLSLMERKKEENCTAEYVTGLVFIVLSILSFFVAITAGSLSGVISAFICFVLFALCAVAVPQVIRIVKHKKGLDGDGNKVDREKLSQADFNAQWAKVRAKLAGLKDIEKKKKLLENTLLFFPLGLDINNGLDFTQPVLMKDDDLYTIAAAVRTGDIDEGEIKIAESLVDELLKEGK